jgi:serine/threonine protein kinase
MSTTSNSNSLSDDDIIEQSDNLELEGSILNEYNILCELGRGAYSIVWLGYNISSLKYYAIKVQNPNEYKEGKSENDFMKQLPKNIDSLNKLIFDFVEVRNNKKFLCSVYELHCSNLDSIIRKGKYEDGLPQDIVKNIMIQLLEGCDHLHQKMKVYHADIKTDNILLKGQTKKINSLIELYNKMNFQELYLQAKKEHNKLTQDKKIKIRLRIHLEIYNKVINILNEYDIDKYDIDEKYISNCKISLADFGSFVKDGEFYDEAFGTRYYRSPENILVGNSSYPNDIWALGCTFYELLTGQILFDPDKDKQFDRDAYHLKLINELCGEFSHSFLKKTKLWKKYFDSNCKLKITKDLNHRSKLEDKLGNNSMIPIIKGMLKINPNERLTTFDCLQMLKEVE